MDACKPYRIYIAYTKNTGLAKLVSPVAYLGRYSSITRYRLIPKTVAPLDDLPVELVQILPAKVGITKATVKIGHREYYPVAVLRTVGQVIGHQGRRLKYACTYCLLAFQSQIC